MGKKREVKGGRKSYNTRINTPAPGRLTRAVRECGNRYYFWARYAKEGGWHQKKGGETEKVGAQEP